MNKHHFYPFSYIFHRSDIHQRAILLSSARPLLWPSRSGCGWGSNWWLPQGMGAWRQRFCGSRQEDIDQLADRWFIHVYPIIAIIDRVSTCFSHVYSQYGTIIYTMFQRKYGGLSGKVIQLNGGFSRPCTGPRWGVGRWVSCWKWVFWSVMLGFKLQIIGICWLKCSSCSLCPYVYWLYLHQIPSFMFFAACFQLEHSKNGAHRGLLQTFHSTFSINPVKFQNSYF